MKLVINTCFGGFGLSNKAITRYAELIGKKVYFFKTEFSGSESRNVPVDEEYNSLFAKAFYIPNPDEYLKESKKWHEMTGEEKTKHNERYSEVSFSARDLKRNDPILVKVVEELGEKANGRCAQLKIVEVPDDIEWQVEEYDGNEHVAEVHQTWS